MSRDVIITPLSGNVEFKSFGVTRAQLQLDTANNLNISTTGGNLTISSGIPGTHLYVGDGTNQSDIVFEQSGAIRALSGKILTLGQSDSTVRVNATALNLDGNTVLQVDGNTVINTAGFWVGPQGGISGFSGAAGAVGTSGFSGRSGFSGAAGPSTTINATNDAATTTLYPVMVGAAGSNQTAKVTTSKLIYNASTGTLSTTNFNSSSDQTLKINTKTLVDGLKTIIQLNPVSFNWKDTGHKAYGVIAQEIENVIPEIVITNGTIKSVSYDQIIPFLIQAVKELKLEIEEIKSRM